MSGKTEDGHSENEKVTALFTHVRGPKAGSLLSGP